MNSKEDVFSPFIRSARDCANLSLSEAADLIGCTKSHLWEMEQGRAPNPTIKTLAGIATAYDIPLAQLSEICAASCPGTAFRIAVSNVISAKAKLAEFRKSDKPQP